MLEFEECRQVGPGEVLVVTERGIKTEIDDGNESLDLQSVPKIQYIFPLTPNTKILRISEREDIIIMGIFRYPYTTNLHGTTNPDSSFRKVNLLLFKIRKRDYSSQGGTPPRDIF